MLKPYNKYGDSLNSYDLIKLLALLSMTLDHLGNYCFYHSEWLRAAGRFAMPAFLFLVGYSSRWNNKRDIVLAALSVMAVALLTHHALLPLNVLATIIVVRWVMRWISVSNRLATLGEYHLLAGCLAAFIPTALLLDYGSLALMFALCGYLRRHHAVEAEVRRFILIALGAHFTLEMITFKFSSLSLLLVCIVFAVLYRMFSTFTVESLRLPRIPAPLQHGLLWLSRNALLYYVLHVSALMLLETMLHPGRFAHFKWIG